MLMFILAAFSSFRYCDKWITLSEVSDSNADWYRFTNCYSYCLNGYWWIDVNYYPGFYQNCYVSQYYADKANRAYQ